MLGVSEAGGPAAEGVGRAGNRVVAATLGVPRPATDAPLRPLAGLGDATGRSGAMSEARRPLWRDRGHDPGRVSLELAVVFADAGEPNADLAFFVVRAMPLSME